MRTVRYRLGDAPAKFGWLLDEKIGEIEGNPFGEYRRREVQVPLADVTLFAPCLPGKILCVGRNYVEHAAELGNEVPKVPLIFMKPASAVIGPGDPIILPPQSSQVEHEGELVVVIGKRARHVPADEAGDFIFGYTIGNDVTARDLQKTDGQWTRAKGFDTFCPIGPWIDTDFDPSDAVVTCRVSGQMRQLASTRDMVFGINTLIAYITSVMTLEPGDLLFTGTPSGVGQLVDGDEVIVEIEGLGALRNPVRAESP